MLGKAAMLTTMEKEVVRAPSESIDDEDDFVDEKPDEDITETEVFLGKFCAGGGHTYRLCPEKWTIND